MGEKWTITKLLMINRRVESMAKLSLVSTIKTIGSGGKEK
jgi:hypothetical protein